MIDVAIVTPPLLLVFALSARYNRRHHKGKYVSGYDRLWREHPEWLVIGLLVAFVVAVLASQ